MGFTSGFLDQIRSEIAPSDDVLAETRYRLNLVRRAGEDFPHALRTYTSGSIAHHTANNPVSDGDGGLVLNRIYYPELGPEGGGETPKAVTDDLCAHLGAEVRKEYPKARCCRSKRGPKIFFGEPLDGQDPTVDLVVALTRREGNGLWIPNLDKDTWEASDPEGHVALLAGGGVALRSTRRRIIRLAKAWNKQFTQRGFSSFQLSVLALEALSGGQGDADALLTFFTHAADSLEKGPTKDPAGVSPALKLLVSKDVAVRRLRQAQNSMGEALAVDDDEEKVRAALAKIFWKYLDDPLASMMKKLAPGRPVSSASVGLLGIPAVVAPARAYGAAVR
jgi:hypothetical protein